MLRVPREAPRRNGASRMPSSLVGTMYKSSSCTAVKRHIRIVRNNAKKVCRRAKFRKDKQCTQPPASLHDYTRRPVLYTESCGHRIYAKQSKCASPIKLQDSSTIIVIVCCPLSATLRLSFPHVCMVATAPKRTDYRRS